MELRDLQYFAVVAKHGNVTRASEALDLSPAALSKSLRRLEHALKAKLVERAPKGVELTPVGIALLSHVQRLTLTFADVAREAADLSQGLAGHLRIGVGATLAETIPDACAKLLEDAPRLTMEIDVTDNDVMFPALRKGELDLIFNVDPEFASEGLVEEHLYYDDFVVCAAGTHPLARLKSVSIASLAEERWTLTPANVPARQWLDRAFAKKGLPAPHVTMETRSARLRFQMIGAAGLLGFMSRRGVRAAARDLGIKELAVKELTWRRSVRVIYRKDTYLSPAARRMIAVLSLAKPSSVSSRA
jgi:DNA-binding transcriptional LysR family regulator